MPSACTETDVAYSYNFAGEAHVAFRPQQRCPLSHAKDKIAFEIRHRKSVIGLALVVQHFTSVKAALRKDMVVRGFRARALESMFLLLLHATCAVLCSRPVWLLNRHADEMRYLILVPQ